MLDNKAMAAKPDALALQQQKLATQILRELTQDLQLKHPEEAEHLSEVVRQEVDLVAALRCPTSRLWGAIPLEILGETEQGMSYIQMLDLLADKTALLPRKTEAETEDPLASTPYIENVIKELFGEDPMAAMCGSDPDMSKMMEMLPMLTSMMDGTGAPPNPDDIQLPKGLTDKIDGFNNGQGIDFARLESELQVMMQGFTGPGSDLLKQFQVPSSSALAAVNELD